MRAFVVLAALAIAAAPARAEEDYSVYHRLRWELEAGGAAYSRSDFQGGGPYVAFGVREHRFGALLDYRQLYGSGVVFHRFGLAARYNFISCCSRGVESYEAIQVFVEAGGALGVLEGGGLRGDAQVGLGLYIWPIRTKSGRNLHVGPRVSAIYEHAPSYDVFARIGGMVTISLSYGN